MKTTKIVTGVIIILTICISSCYTVKNISQFMYAKNLADIKNIKSSISQYVDNQPFVLVFIAAECPISQKYAPILRGVQAQFPQVKLLAVFTKWDKTETIKDFLKEYPLNLSTTKDEIIVLKDKDNGLIKKIDAQITPEAFLFDKNGVLIYRGAIDNWFFALGKHRPEATEHYLIDAIHSFFKNEPIKIKQTNAVGCIIEK